MGKTKNYSGRSFAIQIIIVLIAAFCLFEPLSVVAISIKDYFQLNYDPITFSKTKVQGSEIFYIQGRGKASCIKSLPILPNEAKIIGRVVAKHKTTGKIQILNSGYTFLIKPFPKKKSQSYEIKKKIALQFPKTSQSGEYTIVGELIKAEIKLPLIGWKNVTSYFPSSREIGTVKYITNKTKK